MTGRNVHCCHRFIITVVRQEYTAGRDFNLWALLPKLPFGSSVRRYGISPFGENLVVALFVAAFAVSGVIVYGSRLLFFAI